MTRHASMADQLTALKAAVRRPGTPIEPVQTNWSTIAANDNSPEDLADKRVERRWSIRPTEDEIIREVRDGAVVLGKHVDDKGGQHTVTVAIGKLRFSDGSQKERAFAYGPEGKLVMYDAPMPVGAMLGTKDKQERMLGGDGAASSNAPYAVAYGGKLPSNVSRKKKPEPPEGDVVPEKPVKLSKEEMRAELAKAVANTARQPAVRYGQKGFPWQPAKLRDLFMGFEKGRKGETGSIAWQDISSHIVEREIWHETIAALSKDDGAALAALDTAGSFADVGVAAGQSRLYADKKGGGKRKIKAVNDNIAEAYRKAIA
ncbi:hypothetical protein NKI98_21590 [Mesorhizobium sp. M0222]|uniref:hypothetical protein n=1 Tax=Mesorhizobium sp. M0222 TaxID=2956921 RepID=UPI0033386B23